MTRSSDELLDLSADKAVACIVIGHLDAATKAIGRLSKPHDTEALHDFRVAVRRARSVFGAYRPWLGKAAGRKVRRRLRNLVRSTNAGRDAEVQIEWLEKRRSKLRRGERSGLNWLLRRLRKIKLDGYAAARKRVTAEFIRVDKSVRSRFAKLIPARPEPFRSAFGTLLQRHAAAAAERLSEIVSAADARHSHAARLGVKRLRYLVEPVATSLPDGNATIKRLKALQDLLGELNDMHVLAATVESDLKWVSSRKTKRMHDLALEGRERELASERRRDERDGLVRIACIVRQRRDELFATLQEEWLSGQVATFTEALQLQGAVFAAEGRHKEVERKFLLSGLPHRVRETPYAEIVQGWLPGTQLRERLRRTSENGNDRYYRTVKLGSGVERLEIEEEATRELFETMWPLTEGCRVQKRRYRITEGPLVWEIDDFTDRDLVLAEVELPSRNTPVVLPAWLEPHVVREVTGEAAYVNLNLAR